MESKEQNYFADWASYASKRQGTVIGEYQKLNRLQGIKKIYPANKDSIKNSSLAINGE